MVKRYKMRIRRAFTMIELIFAIVIIAVSVMSLPMISQITSDSIDNNLAQEAVFAAVAEINFATTYYWDENSNLDNAIADSTRVINNGDCNTTTKKRSGHIHRRCLDNLAITYSTVPPINCVESVDSNEHNWTVNVEGSAPNASATGYKRVYESKLDVERCNGLCTQFGLDASNPNLKEIQVTIRDNDNNNTVTILRTYTANIGEVQYALRSL